MPQDLVHLFLKSDLKENKRDFFDGLMVKNLPSNARDTIPSLVRELASHLPPGNENLTQPKINK